MRTLILKFDHKIGVQAALRYCIIGGLSAAISFLSFGLLWSKFHVHYHISVTISYILAILFNFSCNRYFTFKSSGSCLSRHVYRYMTMIILNYAITILIVHIAVEGFSLSPYIGLLASIVVTAITGFTLSKLWVYSTSQ